MKPTEILMQEHRVIEQVLDCLEKIAERCESEGQLDGESARQTVDFFRQFADRCHHGKEEQRLFPMMHAKGFPEQQGPVAVMKIEHEQGRALIGGMDQAIEGAAAGEVVARDSYLKNARGYLHMLREHIQKEDHCLFPMADQAFGEEEQRKLAEEFDRVERDEIGAGVRESYVELANELADRYGVAKDRIPPGASHAGCGH